MLIKLHTAIEAGKEIKIEKRVKGCDASRLGAFAKGERIDVCVTLPRSLGVSAVVLRLAPDGGEATDVPLCYAAQEQGCDRYETVIDTALLCGDAPDGLFFYEFLFLRGFDTLFTDSINNVDFRLCDHTAERFRLLVYDTDYKTPDWFAGGVMYHVFPDRFCRGEGSVSLRPGAVLDEDWQNGVPQFAKKAGAPLANNVFFGGNLWGVTEKLDYLKSLGVTVIYLSPIFEAASNHRYDTADYETVDRLLGGDEAFDRLIEAAHEKDIRIILDGVFNHTGDDSKYFNKRANFDTVGAYQSQNSPYADWFSFQKFPTDYEAWWGIEIMPRLQQANSACRSYFTGKDGIAAKWLRRGADGWRLDVADELPDVFLDELRTVCKESSDGQALLIGEVWENAVDKISYGSRRRYFRGGQLDSVMNYPFRNAVLALLLDRDAKTFYNVLTELWGSYPRFVSHSLMNLLGTHDTERILSLLGDRDASELENPELALKKLTAEQRAIAIKRLKIASILQFTVFGVPSVYYGDEAGSEGYHDPFCRRPFPWGRENAELLAHYRALGALRAQNSVLKNGDFIFLEHSDGKISFERQNAEGRLFVAVNMDPSDWKINLSGSWKNPLSGEISRPHVTLPPESAIVLVRGK